MKKKTEPPVFIMFVRHCVLFKTKEKLYWLFGVFVWLDLAVFIYAVTQFFAVR